MPSQSHRPARTIRQGLLAAASVVTFAGLALGQAAPADNAAQAAQGERVDYRGHALVRVWAADDWEFNVVAAAADRLMSETPVPGGMSEWILDADGIAALDDAGIVYAIIEDDVSVGIEAERARINARQVLPIANRNAWYADYKTKAEIYARLDTFEAQYPDLISEEIVGTSVFGEPIYGYTITGPNGDPNAKPGMLFNGTIHAREWVSPMAVMYIIEGLVTDYGTDPAVTEVMDSLTWYIIPVLNPDGYQYAWDSDRYWRKNRAINTDSFGNPNGTRGVDLNRNFPVGFGGQGSSSSGSSDIYHGPAPFSEPESVALRDWLLGKPNVIAHIDFHSYSQLILWPIGYTSQQLLPAEDLANFQTLSFAMRDRMIAETGVTYTAQNSADLYVAGGVTSDWAFEDAGVYSWTFELRPETSFQGGFELPPSQILGTGRENLAAVLELGTAAIDRARFFFVGGTPSVIDAGQTETVAFRVSSLFGDDFGSATAELNWRIGSTGPFTTVPAVPVTDGFEATIPAQGCGVDIEFFVEAETATGQVVRAPRDAGTVFTAEVVERDIVAEDTFEADSGWTVGDPSDTAFTGIWNRANPQATAAQPGEDITPGSGTDCWVTDANAGTSLGSADVDGGATSLISPAYDVSAGTSVAVSYWRWFSNNQGAAPGEDVFRVFISDDGGSTWSLLEEVGPTGAEAQGGWYFAQPSTDGIVQPTSAVRLKFVAEDAGSGSIVEAAIDDLTVVAIGQCCPGDADGSGTVTALDISLVLSAFGSTGLAPNTGGDVTGDGNVTALDISAVLSNFGTECN